MPEVLKGNLKKVITGALIVFALFILIITLIASSKTPSAQVGKNTLSLYVARNSKDQQIGLSKYKSIPNKKGMVFVFDKPGYYPFWMKGMQFPIDMIFISGSRVVTVFENVSKEKSDSLIFYPTQPADKVLEVNAGMSSKLGIKEGSIIEFKNL